MKALTIHQPYASLIAVGAKHYETRSWKTSYRGPIAIHAGKEDWADKFSSEETGALVRAFAGTRYEVRHNRFGGGFDYIYPYGAIIAVADLVECWCCSGAWPRGSEGNPYANIILNDGTSYCTPNFLRKPEILFGDFSAGRFAWELVNVRMLPEPIRCKGRQRIWDISEDEELIVRQEIRRNEKDQD